MATPSTTQPSEDPVSRRRYWWTFAAIVAAFLLFRLPLMYRMPGGIDEEQYAVPGLTILKNGIPQMPQYPSRNEYSVFYHADVVMYCMPPAYFYFQSLFYLILPAVYGTARLSTATAGIVLLLLVGDLTRRWTGSRSAGLWAAGLYSFCRVFFQYATKARPDVMCATLGLAAVWAICKWQEKHRWPWLVLSGVFIGLGGLTHPFALAYAMQIGVWVLWESRGWRRIGNAALVTIVSLLVFSLWVPLILIDREAFEIVCKNQYGTSDSLSLVGRMLHPWESLSFHFRYMYFFVGGWWQLILEFLPLIGCTIYCLFVRNSGLRTACLLSWSALYLICTISGTWHLTWGYFAYPGALMIACTGAMIAATCSWLGRFGRGGVLVVWVMSGALAFSMLFGSYIKVLKSYLVNWNNIDYNAPRFAQHLMADIPQDARCTVDKEFLLDFYVSGRPTLAAESVPFYFAAQEYPYDYFFCGRFAKNALVMPVIPQMCGELIRTEGNEADPFACYVEIYRPSPTPCAEIPYEPPYFDKSPAPVQHWSRKKNVEPTPFEKEKSSQ